MTGRRRAAADAPTVAEELRGLIREAHAAVKDLHAAMRAARVIADNAAQFAHDAVAGELLLAAQQIQADMNHHAATLNAGVETARGEIIRQLTLTKLRYCEADDSFTVEFGQGQFDEHGQVQVSKR